MDSISIQEAALRIGCDHHYVRALIARKVIEVDHLEPVNKSVNKVFVTKLSVKQYMESRRERFTYHIRVTHEEQDAVRKLLRDMRQLPDW